MKIDLEAIKKRLAAYKASPEAARRPEWADMIALLNEVERLRSGAEAERARLAARMTLITAALEGRTPGERRTTDVDAVVLAHHVAAVVQAAREYDTSPERSKMGGWALLHVLHETLGELDRAKERK